MERTLANLKVVVSDDPNGVSGIDCEGGNFKLRMYPFQTCVACRTKQEFQTVMAHELGHFVCEVTKDETHVNGRVARYMALLEPSLKPKAAKQELEAERKAWMVAQEIKPDLEQGIAADCLKSYEDEVTKLAGGGV